MSLQSSCRGLLVALIAVGASGWVVAQAPPDAGAPGGAPPVTPEANAQPAALPPAPPDRKDLAVWLGHVESDNLPRNALEEDGSFESVGLLVGLERQSARVDASLNGDLEYRSYSLDEIDDETVGSLNASAVIDAVQDRFTWSFRDRYGQGLRDPFAPVGPENREKINEISTGPRLTLPVGARSSMELGAGYAERRYAESTNVDSDVVSYDLGFFRQASRTARFGFLASTEETDYVDVLSPEYKIDRLSLHYDKELATGRVLADIGTNQIESNGFDSDEPLFRFEWIRSLTARSTLDIRAAREFTDAGGQLRANVGTPDEQNPNAAPTAIVVAPNPLEQKRLNVAYVLTLSRTVLSAALGLSENTYIGTAALDYDETTTTLSFVRTISSRLGFGLSYSRDKRDSADAPTPSDGKDAVVSAWLNRTLGRRFSAALALSQYERTGTQSFDERRWEIRFGYSPTDSANAAMRSVGR